MICMASVADLYVIETEVKPYYILYILLLRKVNELGTNQVQLADFVRFLAPELYKNYL